MFLKTKKISYIWISRSKILLLVYGTTAGVGEGGARWGGGERGAAEAGHWWVTSQGWDIRQLKAKETRGERTDDTRAV